MNKLKFVFTVGLAVFYGIFAYANGKKSDITLLSTLFGGVAGYTVYECLNVYISMFN